MSGWAVTAARFDVYVTLAAAFGVPLQALIDGWSIRRLWLVAIVGTALLSSLVALLVLIASMAGTAILPVDGEMLRIVLVETPVGAAFVVRFAVLAAALGGSWLGSRVGTIIVCVSGGIALTTVAWTGHGAMQDGAVGMIHLVADILHMLAGAAWLGAMVVLLAHVSPTRHAAADRAAAHTALNRFALTGSVLVMTVVVTGAVNGWMIVGLEGVMTLPFSVYGALLLAKLALFLVMLVLAAHHRWISGPRVGAAVQAGWPDAAMRRIRRSIAIEFAAGIAVLGIVAYLGTLPPP